VDRAAGTQPRPQPRPAFTDIRFLIRDRGSNVSPLCIPRVTGWLIIREHGSGEPGIHNSLQTRRVVQPGPASRTATHSSPETTRA
jgi:hypothetical protein